MNTYNWRIPDDPNLSCVLRIRYNISTNDFAAWDTTVRDNGRCDIREDFRTAVNGINTFLRVSALCFQIFPYQRRSRKTIDMDTYLHDL